MWHNVRVQTPESSFTAHYYKNTTIKAEVKDKARVNFGLMNSDLIYFSAASFSFILFLVMLTYTVLNNSWCISNEMKKVLLWPLLKRRNWQLIVSVKRNIPVQPSETWLNLLSIKAHRCHFDVTSYNIYCMKTLRQCLSSSINPMVYLLSYRYWHV